MIRLTRYEVEKTAYEREVAITDEFIEEMQKELEEDKPDLARLITIEDINGAIVAMGDMARGIHLNIDEYTEWIIEYLEEALEDVDREYYDNIGDTEFEYDAEEI